MPLRIAHTADVHLDAAFSESRLPAAKGRRKRRAIREAFKAIIDDCVEWPANVLVVAGDLFEGERVSADTLGLVARQFERLAPAPVVISPGNHDPFREGGYYDVYEWPENVHIFTSRRMRVLDLPGAGARFFGCAHESGHMEGRLLDFAEPPGGSGECRCVLVAHASNADRIPRDKRADDIWLPFTEEELSGLGFDYAALGHYHGLSQITDEAGELAGAYPGSPEGLRFSEEGPRFYLRVTLEESSVRIERRRTSQIEYLTRSVRCDDMRSRDEFHAECLRQVRSLRNRESIIARFIAEGTVDPGFDLAGDLPEELASQLFHVLVEDSTRPAYDWDALAAEKSLRGELVRHFAAQMEGAEEEEAERLRQARLLAVRALDGQPLEVPPEVLRAD